MTWTKTYNSLIAIAFSVLIFAFFFTGAIAATSEGNCGIFTDIKASDSRCEAILYAYNQKIFQGYNVTTYSDSSAVFKADNNINRAEVLKVALAAFVNQDFSQEKVYGSEFTFKDIVANDTQWWFSYLKYARNEGMVQGYPDGTFKPTKDVTRAEFLKLFLYFSPQKTTIDNWEIIQDASHYVGLWADTPVYAWYAKYIAFANKNGLFAHFGNCPSGSICPERAINRGEVAVMIYNYHNYLKTDVGFLNNSSGINCGENLTCALAEFKACNTASKFSVNNDVLSVTYAYTIVGWDGNRCKMSSVFTKNPNPDYLNKATICSYTTNITAMDKLVTDMAYCSGFLKDL